VSTKAVKTILESRLSSWAAARTPVLRIAYENAAFTPNAGETYLRANLLPADTESQDLAGAHRGYRGVFQVLIVRPVNGGAGPVLNIAAELNALFPVNGRYTSGAITVQTTTPASAAPALQDESSYIVPVSLQYRADTI